MTGRRPARRAAGWPATLVALLVGCDPGPEVVNPVAGGDPDRGRVLMDAYGCGSCHIIPDVGSARGLAGPPLTSWALRDFIAGAAPNTPENLIAWIVDPDVLEPGTAMPDLDVGEAEARDMAAYLFSLREVGERER